MNQRIIVIGVGVLVLVAFLLGFIPQYVRSRDVAKQLNTTRQELASDRARLQADQVDLLIGYVYLQTNLKNYGLASGYSTKFFNQVRTMADQSTDPNQQKFAKAALSNRDAVTGALAKGDPAVAAAVQGLFQSALDTLDTGWK
ncbi:MAG TPA: hypothetical protein VME43_18520 [Bryobacteraceae bacterium]|nr:hypothetical protein [Bryobacteraceae bacterium]